MRASSSQEGNRWRAPMNQEGRKVGKTGAVVAKKILQSRKCTVTRMIPINQKDAEES